MHLQAASFARDPAAPEANEDALVILPGRAWAVIDGVSDRSGARYDGDLAGRHAARTVAAAVERLLLGPPPPVESIVPTLTAALAEAHRRHGMLAAAQADWGLRLCCTLALALRDGPLLHLVLVGDSGIRVNGREVLQMEKDLDRITATLRAHAWHAVADPAQRDAAARQVVRHGTAQPPPPPFDAAALAAIAAAAAAECAATLPHVPAADIAHLIRHGIVGAQGDYQNTTDSILGYGCLDGFPIPRPLYRIATRDAGAIASLELFTDGYPQPGDAFGLSAWEAAHAAADAEDPARIARFRSTKGATPGRFADDRTYLGVIFGE